MKKTNYLNCTGSKFSIVWSEAKLRLFLDANILFTAAHNLKGKAAFVIELGSRGEWELFTSFYALEEAHRNLDKKYPHTLQNLKIFQASIKLVRHSDSLFFPKGLSEKDRPIFQAAVACKATHLITGDIKDFGYIMNQPEKTSGIRIQTVGDFLGMLTE